MLCLLESICCTFHSRKGGDHVALLTPCVTLECRVCEASSIYQQSSPAKAGRRQDSPAPFDCAQGRLRETGGPGSPLLGELGRRSAGYALMALLASLRHARMPGLRASPIHQQSSPAKAGRRQDSPAPFDCAQGRLRETGVPGSPLLGELGRRSAGYALF